MKYIPYFLSSLLVLLFSCQSTPKDIIYFQDYTGSEPRIIESAIPTDYEPVIVKNDILYIVVYSPTKYQDLVAQFNLPLSTTINPEDRAASQTTSLQSFRVDNNGCIDYPVLGKVYVEGMTAIQARKMMEEKIAQYVKDAIVTLDLSSFSVAVLGEVNAPGYVGARAGRLTILDAITSSGDLTIYGKRTNILITRERYGKREQARVDLTRSDIFTSPYFYLQPNDIVYVEPNDSKQKDSVRGEQNTFSFVLSSILGVVSLATTVLTVWALTK